MANHDYKNRPSYKMSTQMITGIVIGILIGLAIALAVALYINSAPSPFRQQVTAQANVSEDKSKLRAPAGKTDAKPEAQKSRFTYYDILPGSEKPVTEQEIKQAPQGKLDQYYLQAGAFQTEIDANNLKAKLALMGVETVIQTASVPDKGVWHRVRVGPFSDIEEINKARTTLSQNGIQPSLIKVLEGTPTHQ